MNTCWKKMNGVVITLIALLLLLSNQVLIGQCFEYPPGSGNYVTALGEPCTNTIITAVPFLRIAPDARSGGMGEAGIAVSADANSIHFNASKLAFAEDRVGLSFTYIPWLRETTESNLFLGYGAAYYQINALNTLSFGAKYFSLNSDIFTNQNGMPLGGSDSREWEINTSFTRRIGERFGVGVGAKYIYSNLAAGTSVGGTVIDAGESFAVDLSCTYKTPALTFGLALTNLGTKLTYTNSINKDFIPTNLGLGIAWTKEFKNETSFTFTTDFNKLLVPTPDPSWTDEDLNGVADYQERSVISGALSSFGDAPGGFKEEMREIMYSLGMEYWWQQRVALRFGYFGEHETKGNRKYFTTGVGVRYKFVNINGSYLIPKNEETNPLDNTYRISILFHFGTGMTSNS